MAVQTSRGIPISAVNPKYLHTNSTSHTWPFSAIAELIDNAYDPDVSAKQFWIDKTVVKEQDCLIFMDNGAGMDYDKLHKMLSFGFSDKQTINGHVPVGLYGNGFKSGSMRLGKDAIVFSKKADIMCVGLLSQTYLQKIDAENVIVPVVMFKASGDTLSCAPEYDASLQDILKYSLFNTKEELLCELSAINGPYGTISSGTRIIIWNLRRTTSNELEFDFMQDRYDIRIPVDTYESTKEQNKRLERGTSPPESKYSLRAYTSILYLKPRMQIIIRGQKVKTQLISKSLAHIFKDTYKPTFLSQSQKKGITITFGYNTKTKEHYGVMMYHKNRLIRAYERVACQDKGTSTGVGVIGVIECNYLRPTHNKQEFDNTDEYRKTMQSLSTKLEDYWKEVRHRLQKNCTEPVEDRAKRPDQNWVQCDECLKWRKLPDGIDTERLPEKWFCRLNPEPRFRNCSAPEEREDSDDEGPRYQKTYKQHEKNQKLQEEKNRQQKEQEHKIKEAQKIEALTKQNAALMKEQQNLVRQLRLGTPPSPRSPTQATTSFAPHIHAGTRASDNLPVISNVTSLSTSSRNKRVLGPGRENGAVKRVRISVDDHKPDSPSTSSPTVIIPDNDGAKDDDDIVIIESCSTPRPNQGNSAFDISKVKTEHVENADEPEMLIESDAVVAMETSTSMSSSESTGHINISTQTGQNPAMKKEAEDSVAQKVEVKSTGVERDQLKTEQDLPSVEIRLIPHPIQEATAIVECGIAIANENQTLESQQNRKSLDEEILGPSATVLLEEEAGGQKESALNVQEAQQQQDNLMELLEATAKERDESRAQQHQLIVQVENLQSQLLEFTQSMMKKEQAHQSTQTSSEEIQDYEGQYLEAKEVIKQLQSQLSELKMREQEGQEKNGASAEREDELSCQIDLLLRELDQRNNERDELKEKLDSLESENRALSESCESLRKDFQKAKRDMEELRVSAAQQAQVAAVLPKASNPGREPRLGTQQDEAQEAPENRREQVNSAQTCRLKELRQKVARLLVTFVPALDPQQVNYDCEVIDEILSQVIDEISHTDSSTVT